MDGVEGPGGCGEQAGEGGGVAEDECGEAAQKEEDEDGGEGVEEDIGEVPADGVEPVEGVIDQVADVAEGSPGGEGEPGGVGAPGGGGAGEGGGCVAPGVYGGVCDDEKVVVPDELEIEGGTVEEDDGDSEKEGVEDGGRESSGHLWGWGWGISSFFAKEK